MKKFGIFHNDIGLAVSSFTEETNAKKVAHVGVLDPETNREAKEKDRYYNCYVEGLHILVEEIQIEIF